MVDEIYKIFKSKKQSGAYVTDHGLIYTFSKDVYNESFLPTYNTINQIYSSSEKKQKLNTYQKKMYDLYKETHNKFLMATELLFFTVYNLKSEDLNKFINDYERIKREAKRELEEQQRKVKRKLEEQRRKEQKEAEDKIKNKGMILDFEGIEKVKNIRLDFMGGIIEYIQFLELLIVIR